MRVVVELIATRLVGDDVHFVVATSDCPRRSDPEATARAELARLFPELWLRRIVLRSTGWRFQEDHIVLTYLGYSDDFNVATLPLLVPLVRITELREAPAALAAHAIRHLAFLVRERPAMYDKRLRPETVKALATVTPELAGRYDLPGAA